MTSIKQNLAGQPLPDFRNAGVILRILLGVNLLALFAALVQSEGVGDSVQRYSELAVWVQPLLLFNLTLLALLGKRLRHPAIWIGRALVVLLTAGLAWWTGRRRARAAAAALLLGLGGASVSPSRAHEGHDHVDGGNRLTKGAYKNGYFIEPTVLTNVDRNHRVGQEEIFGPVTSVIPFSTLEEAIDIVNDVKYGLSSAIYTQDVNQAFYAMQELYSGICYINSATSGAEVHLPFGGTKGTGNGHREAGTQVLDIFSEWKAIYVDYSGKLQKAQIDEVEI